jgi:hypothetical protein
VGNFQGNVNGTLQNAYRSGMMDLAFRFSVYLKGGPAMTAEEFSAWHQKTILGASMKGMIATLVAKDGSTS